MKEKLKEIDLVFAVMVDIWTDNIGNRPYINISIQFTSKEFKIYTLHLATEFIERPHTGEKIELTSERVLKTGPSSNDANSCGIIAFSSILVHGRHIQPNGALVETYLN
ncbi:hypothetical protein PVAND_014364 [Polypedilum vanderplanki]|uniref:Uncharacterized protein n=1 Tax=Polypedilum vanderplanki TaxID=319348 RepID=A0A9J6B8Y6_POLVA|nr:hypothetical protein PVAND_014364 [Polypedilum vanderplanki]